MASSTRSLGGVRCEKVKRMFFPEYIKSIKSGDRVLEVGPGALPHPRANTFLERRFTNRDEQIAQSGHETPASLEGRLVYYDGGRFPFEDNEFDYVICSHVIEHVLPHELGEFVSELCRVAPRGYIEFPTVFYELINYQPVHQWLMNARGKVVLLLDKQVFPSGSLHRCYRELFYGADSYMRDSFMRYKEFYVSGFEWEGRLEYKIVESIEELVTEEDYQSVKQYFSQACGEETKEKCVPRANRAKAFLKQLIPATIRQWVRHRMKPAVPVATVSQSESLYVIHPSAQIDRRDLVAIGKHAEIKDYVIIRPADQRVVIGDYVQLNPFCVIYGGRGVTFGNNVMVGPHCIFAAGNHDYLQTEKPMRFAGDLSRGPIVVEENVWIGANCTITDGVVIGRDAVVGANSVVTHDIPSYAIAVGVPARVIGDRRHMKLKTKD